MNASDVSAVIVTRGNVDLTPIVKTLPYSELIVWNDLERGSKGVYGRYLAAQEAANEIVYFQDDDVLFTAHEELLAAYEPERITGNMPSPWYEHMSYDRLGIVLVGAGSLMPRELPWPAFARYLAAWPEDDLFYDYCDFINGGLSPGMRVDLGYEISEIAIAPGRINTRADGPLRRELILQRMLELREAA